MIAIGDVTKIQKGDAKTSPAEASMGSVFKPNKSKNYNPH